MWTITIIYVYEGHEPEKHSFSTLAALCARLQGLVEGKENVRHVIIDPPLPPVTG